MRSRTLVIAAAAALAACSGQRGDAVRQIDKFLAAAAGDDRMAFEARIDRLALRADLKGQLMALPEVRTLREQLGDKTGDVAVDRMITPESFRDLRAGAEPLPPKGDLRGIRAKLKVLAPDRVCLRGEADRDRCQLTFAKQAGAWKLVAIYAPNLKTRALGEI